MKQLNDCRMIVQVLCPGCMTYYHVVFFLIKALWNSACRIYSHCKLSGFILCWDIKYWFWFDFCFTALQHILGNFGRGHPNYTVPGQASQAVYQYLVHILSPVTDNYSSWISGRGRMAVDIFFMTKSPRKNVPDVGIELGAACIPSGHASNPVRDIKMLSPSWYISLVHLYFSTTYKNEIC